VNVLVTGADGYLGAVVAPLLARRGHDVTGVDTGFYLDGLLFDTDDGVAVRRQDVREISASDLDGVDAIVHMGELSNDPLGQFSPSITRAINHAGTVRLARLARERGVTRFVQMSSCSVYGAPDTDWVDEESNVDPQTVYAECKVQVEHDVSELADDAFSPTFLRNATAFGASPRMRFDIVLNNLAGHAWTSGRIAMTSDGTPWRPLVHALDIGQAIAVALEAPRELVHDEVFNVGSNEQNYRVREIAETVGRVFPGCETTFGPSSGDNRSYRVRFDKIHDRFPGFRCCWDAERGAGELLETFRRIDLAPETFAFRGFTRLAQLEYLRSAGAIDDEFWWAR
jgi:nucleoside-diphosphate-sugar epimerase